MNTIIVDVANKTKAELKQEFQAAYDSAPSPLQVSPRSPAVAKVVNADQNKVWRECAKTAGFRFATYAGDTAFVFSLEPLGATYYHI